MSLSRRRFLQSGLALGAGLYLSPAAFASGFPRLRTGRKTLPITQGATDDTRTQFSVVHPIGQDILVTVTGTDGQILSDRHQTFRLGTEKTQVTQAFFSDLRPGVDFRLDVSDRAGVLLDQRMFRTLASDGPELKFSICSCMDDNKHDPAIWLEMGNRQPDVILFIGDSVYADKQLKTGNPANPSTLWRRFSESRSVLEVYHLPRLIPIFAVWDDHDFGKNDTNSIEYPFLAESTKNFLTFFPQDPGWCRYLQRGPGISSALDLRGQRILLLDDRTFRMPSGQGGRYGHWGKDQEDWALEQVRGASGTTWLMNGSQFFPSVVWKESVSRNHPEQLAGLVSNLRALGRPVAFASGDVHYSEVSRLESSLLGFETFELTSSSIHSQSMPGFPDIVPNPRRILSTGKRNFTLVQAAERSNKATCIASDGSRLFQHEFILG